MSQNDPTDQALAAIAGILNRPASPPESEVGHVEEKTTAGEPSILDAVFQESIRPEPAVQETENHEPVQDNSEPEPLAQESALHEPILDDPVSLAHEPQEMEADGYFKYGPGPLAAIRFKWTVRHEGGDAYYVDETIGENSTPIVMGPMSAYAAVQLVDDRENAARRRFEQIKSEMTVRNMASDLVVSHGDKV